MYRVQQRLKYFDFSGSLGEVIDVNGDATLQPAANPFFPGFNPNGTAIEPKKWQTTEAAICIFQAATKANGAGDPTSKEQTSASFVDGIVDKEETDKTRQTIDWLNS